MSQYQIMKLIVQEIFFKFQQFPREPIDPSQQDFLKIL